jgi:hypothetical protein
VIKTHHNDTQLVRDLRAKGRILEPLADYHKVRRIACRQLLLLLAVALNLVMCRMKFVCWALSWDYLPNSFGDNHSRVRLIVRFIF